jgi:hypothetical protein
MAMDVHHRNEDWQDNSPDNLERICRSCHNLAHDRKGSCTVCGSPQKGLGLCDMHYQRFKKYGDPLVVKDNQFVPARKEGGLNPAKTCGVAGCPSPYHANGYCARHAQQARRGRLGLDRSQSDAVRAS